MGFEVLADLSMFGETAVILDTQLGMVNVLISSNTGVNAEFGTC